MKILIVTNNLYPELNANSEIAYCLGKELKNKYGHDVTILGYRDNDKLSNVDNFVLKEYVIAYIGQTRSIMSSHDTRILKLIKLLLHPAAFFYFLKCKVKKNYTMADEYTKAIRRLSHICKFDFIICFKNPKETIEGAIKANVEIPIIAYELDPWESDILTQDELRDFQYEIERNCSAIVTTNLLYPTYVNWRISIEDVYKLEFPNIVYHHLSSSNMFRDGKIHCVFAGQLYDDIRNPQYTIDLFSKFPNSFVLDIFGNDNGCLKDVCLPNNVIYHGLVDSDASFAYAESADILVNIGNTLLNQMPSKILTYISMGKPILNIMKSPKCPTIEYMKKYPLSLNIVEQELVDVNTVNQIISFCENSIGKSVDFSYIEKTYRTATPDYVGNMLNGILFKYIRR